MFWADVRKRFAVAFTVVLTPVVTYEVTICNKPAIAVTVGTTATDTAEAILTTRDSAAAGTICTTEDAAIAADLINPVVVTVLIITDDWNRTPVNTTKLSSAVVTTTFNVAAQ